MPDRTLPVVIPGCREAASPEYITTDRGYGPRARGLRPRPGVTPHMIRILETLYSEASALPHDPEFTALDELAQANTNDDSKEVCR
jgi:hypothetical protein